MRASCCGSFRSIALKQSTNITSTWERVPCSSMCVSGCGLILFVWCNVTCRDRELKKNHTWCEDFVFTRHLVILGVSHLRAVCATSGEWPQVWIQVSEDTHTLSILTCLSPVSHLQVLISPRMHNEYTDNKNTTSRHTHPHTGVLAEWEFSSGKHNKRKDQTEIPAGTH